MKCDICHWRNAYTLGADECGAGNIAEFCSAGHWSDPGDLEPEQLMMDDPWENCKDYKEEK